MFWQSVLYSVVHTPYNSCSQRLEAGVTGLDSVEASNSKCPGFDCNQPDAREHIKCEGCALSPLHQNFCCFLRPLIHAQNSPRWSRHLSNCIPPCSGGQTGSLNNWQVGKQADRLVDRQNQEQDQGSQPCISRADFSFYIPLQL